MLGNLIIFCQGLDASFPGKQILAKGSSLAITFSQVFELLQFELKTLALNCYQESETKRIKIELPIECLDLMLAITQVFLSNKISTKT